MQKWALLPTDFNEKAGDLTPTLKLKRSVVADKYKDLIDSVRPLPRHKTAKSYRYDQQRWPTFPVRSSGV